MRIAHSTQSLSSDDSMALQEPERRGGARIHTVMRVGRVVAMQDEGLARIKNISDQGAQLRLHIPVLVGETLTLELSEDVQITGRAVWISGNECGLQFSQNIDCGELLTRLAHCSEQGSRPVRLSVSTTAVTRGENGLRLAKVTDVSQRGMKLQHDGSLTEGLIIKISLPSGRERFGVVRWSKDSVAGIMLLKPFSAEDLGSARNL